MPAQPLLSIGVPIYNKGPLLARLFESIRRQNLPDLEVVAVNNASEDNTREALEAWQDRLNLKVYTLPRTISLYDNWLLAISLGTGKYLKLQLADDWIPDGALAPMIDVLEKHGNIGTVLAKSLPIDERGEEITTGLIQRHVAEVNEARRQFALARTMKEKARAFARVRIGGSTLGDPNPVIFRASLLPHLRGGVDKLTAAFQTWPEYELTLRLFAAADVTYLDLPGSHISYDRQGSLRSIQKKEFRRRAKDVSSLNSFTMLLLDPDLRPLTRELGLCYFTKLTLWHITKLLLIALGRR